METNQTISQPIWYKRKAVIMPLVVLLLAGLVTAAVLYANIPATATVGEALSTTTVSADYSGFPGETICKSVDVANAANVPLDTQFSWEETANANGVTYTTNMPLTQMLASGANTVNACLTYDNSTVAGSITGNINLTRV